MLELLRKTDGHIPNLAGIKFTSTNLMSLQECLEFEDGRFNILFGCDEMLLSALALGVPGAVGSTYNYCAPLYHSIIAAISRRYGHGAGVADEIRKAGAGASAIRRARCRQGAHEHGGRGLRPGPPAGAAADGGAEDPAVSVRSEALGILESGRPRVFTDWILLGLRAADQGFRSFGLPAADLGLGRGESRNRFCSFRGAQAMQSMRNRDRNYDAASP